MKKKYFTSLLNKEQKKIYICGLGCATEDIQEDWKMHLVKAA